MKKPIIRHRKVPEGGGNLFFTSPREHLALINSGCELLNCTVGGGWPMGRVVNIVGDKSSGKSLLSIEALANFNRAYPDGHSAYCETEAAFDDDYAKALGIDLRKVERPECDTVEELFASLNKFIDAVGENGHGLYIVDSLDAISDKAEQGRDINDASYGGTKPKKMGEMFRRLVKKLEASGTCLIFISQVRDAIGVMFGEKHTRTGGRALDFYASQIVWLAHVGQIKRTVSKLQRTIGVRIKAKVKKNKIGLPFRECEFEILFGYGIDDVSSNLAFLKDSGRLGKLGIASTEQAISSYRKSFDSLTPKVQEEVRARIDEIVRQSWYEIESTFLPKRGKYSSFEPEEQ